MLQKRDLRKSCLGNKNQDSGKIDHYTKENIGTAEEKVGAKKRKKKQQKEVEESFFSSYHFYFYFYLDQNLSLYEVTGPTSYINILVKKFQKMVASRLPLGGGLGVYDIL